MINFKCFDIAFDEQKTFLINERFDSIGFDFTTLFFAPVRCWHLVSWLVIEHFMFVRNQYIANTHILVFFHRYTNLDVGYVVVLGRLFAQSGQSFI